MTIRTIYTEKPTFPATDQHPDAKRYKVGDYWVDAVDGKPSLDDVVAVLSPPAEQGDPVQKIREFLAANPDVQEAIR